MRYIAIAILAAIVMTGCADFSASRAATEQTSAARYLDSRVVKDAHGCAFTVTHMGPHKRDVRLRLVAELSDPACVNSVYKD